MWTRRSVSPVVYASITARKWAATSSTSGLKARKAIYRPFPQSEPATYIIEPEACLNFLSFLTERQKKRLKKMEAYKRKQDPSYPPNILPCGHCMEACEVDAIDFDMLPSRGRDRRGLDPGRGGFPGVRRAKARQLRLWPAAQRRHQPGARTHAQRVGRDPGPCGAALGSRNARGGSSSSSAWVPAAKVVGRTAAASAV